jgi:hypothetical protein
MNTPLPNDGASASGAPPAARGRRGCLAPTLLAGLVLALLAAGYTWATLRFVYSEGDRAGVLQKFSRKGWICKTWEGELALYVVAGVAPEIWTFSVRDAALAEELARSVGERIQLHYTEHRGVPTTCFGETSYFARRFERIDRPLPDLTR